MIHVHPLYYPKLTTNHTHNGQTRNKCELHLDHGLWVAMHISLGFGPGHSNAGVVDATATTVLGDGPGHAIGGVHGTGPPSWCLRCWRVVLLLLLLLRRHGTVIRVMVLEKRVAWGFGTSRRSIPG